MTFFVKKVIFSVRALAPLPKAEQHDMSPYPYAFSVSFLNKYMGVRDAQKRFGLREE